MARKNHRDLGSGSVSKELEEDLAMNNNKNSKGFHISLTCKVVSRLNPLGRSQRL